MAAELASEMRSSCLGVRIGRLNRLVTRRFERALRPIELTVPQLEVLATLALEPDPVRPADLSNWLALERSTVSRNLALMERRGYVTTTETSASGRSRRITITADGQTMLAQAEHAWREVNRSVTRELGDHAMPTLNAWLETLTNTQEKSPAAH